MYLLRRHLSLTARWPSRDIEREWVREKGMSCVIVCNCVCWCAWGPSECSAMSRLQPSLRWSYICQYMHRRRCMCGETEKVSARWKTGNACIIICWIVRSHREIRDTKQLWTIYVRCACSRYPASCFDRHNPSNTAKNVHESNVHWNHESMCVQGRCTRKKGTILCRCIPHWCALVQHNCTRARKLSRQLKYSIQTRVLSIVFSDRGVCEYVCMCVKRFLVGSWKLDTYTLFSYYLSHMCMWYARAVVDIAESSRRYGGLKAQAVRQASSYSSPYSSQYVLQLNWKENNLHLSGS